VAAEAERPKRRKRPRQSAPTTPTSGLPAPGAAESPPAAELEPTPVVAEAPPASDERRDRGLLNVLALARRDLAGLLRWPVAYGIAAAVVVPVAILGYLLPVFAGEPMTMEGVFGWVAVMTAILIPLVAVRLLADPRRSGDATELVAAGWLAGVVFFLATTAFTLLYAALLAVYEPHVDKGAIAAGYMGIVLVGAAWVALGLLASSLTGNRVLAAATGVAGLLVLQYVLGTAAGFLPPPVSDLLDYASAANRAQSFERGQVALRDVVYFVSLTAGGLLLAARTLAARRSR
jgi:ABC-2 type transport system permease protein